MDPFRGVPSKRQLALKGITAEQAIAALGSGEAQLTKAQAATKAHGKAVRVTKEPKAATPATRTRKATTKATTVSAH